MVKISPEWVTGPEQGKSSGRIATFSLWTGTGERNVENMAKSKDCGQSGLRKEEGTSLASSQSRQQPPKANSFALKTEEARSCEVSVRTNTLHYTGL